MRRLRWLMILGATALAFTGCVDRESDDAQGATSLDDTAATDPAEAAAQATTVALGHGPLPFDPCPCDQPICRPGCTKPVIVTPACTGSTHCGGGPPPAPAPLPLDPCPCTDPICRPVCKNP